MKTKLFALLAMALISSPTLANDQPVLDACIASWGAKSPFKKGTPAETTIGTGVKVFGAGSSQTGNDTPTSHPALILVRPAVNVLGKSTIRLSNPKGWYCFRSNVTVAGKINIEVPCNAMIASARDDGTTVGAVDDSNRGVAVFGALRVTRYGCPGAKPK